MAEAAEGINIEQILREIKIYIEQNQLQNDILYPNQVEHESYFSQSANIQSSASRPSVSDELNQLKQQANVQADKVLKSNRNPIGFLIIFVKKIIRRLTRFYIKPVVAEQNEINIRIISVLELLHKSLIEDDKEIRQ